MARSPWSFFAPLRLALCAVLGSYGVVVAQEAQPAVLQVIAPATAQVLLNGQLVSEAGPLELLLAPGRHLVRVRQRGQWGCLSAVMLRPDGRTTVRCRLSPMRTDRTRFPGQATPVRLRHAAH